MMSIRRWVETDTGHRVPNHASKCRHIHGHRYRWEAEITGELVVESGATDEGMIMDFGDVSAILNERIHDVVDHAFLIHEKDMPLIEAMTSFQSTLHHHHRTVILPFVPTAENLARWAYEQVAPHLLDRYAGRLHLAAFHVRETPKSWASWRPRS